MHNQNGSLWDARELLWSFVRRDLTVRYRSAVLGVAWALLAPLLQTVIFALVFSASVAGETRVAYPLFAFSGLALWGLTAAGLRGAVTSLSSHAFLVSKVAFRREVLPLASVVVAAVDLAVALVLLAALMAYYGTGWHATLALVPLLVLLQALFVAGLALLLAAANLWWHDVRHVFDAGIVLWMFASAVLYPVPTLDGVLGTLLTWNPMTHFLQVFRGLLFEGALPDAASVAVLVCSAFGALAIGLGVFRRVSPRFAEVA